MKVHIRQIPLEGLHLEGEEKGIEFDTGDEYVKCLTPVNYSLDVGLSETGLFATGTLGIDLELQCVKCLEKFEYPLWVEAFALQTELEGAETVDLTPFMREDILLSLPHYPHCDWDGQKVCNGSPGFKSMVDQDAAREPIPASEAWNELDKLKVKKKK